MGVEQALIQQIVATIDATYLEDVLDCTTNSINVSVAALLLHLQETYGTLMPHEFQEKEDKSKKTIYNPRDPIASIFLVVDNLVELFALAATPLSSVQQVNIGYVILHKTGKISLPIVEWNQKPVVDNTWANFKTHFRTAHKELRATTDLTAQDAGMYHSNMDRDVVAALQETMYAPAEPAVVPTEVIHAPSPPTNFDTQMANAMAATDATKQQMFQQMQTMMETMQSMNINNGGGSSNHGGNNHQHGRWNQNNNNNGNRGYQGNRNQNNGSNNGNNNNGNINNNQNGNIIRKNNQTDYCWTLDCVITR